MQDQTSPITPAKNQTKPWRIELINHPWREPAEPFHVELQRDAIDDLIADARHAHRVYELMMIRRPGDVWKYLWVRMLKVPQPVAESVAWRRKEKSTPLSAWPEDCIPLTEFDACFSWAWDDTTPDSQTWLTHRGSKTFKKVADALLAEVTQAQDELQNCDDPLIEAEIKAVKTNSHFHDHDALAPYVLTPPGHVSITAPKRTQGYYQKLREVVARADVRIVSADADSDFQTLRIICAEQRRRANATGSHPCDAMPLNIMTEDGTPFDRWGACYRGWQEGIGMADLLIDCGTPSMPLKQYDVSSDIQRRDGFRLMLTPHTAASEVPGWKRTEDRDWVFYEDERPERGNQSIWVERELASFKEVKERLLKNTTTAPAPTDE